MYVSNEASPQTDQPPGEVPTRRGLSGVSGLRRFVRPSRFAAKLLSGTLRLPRDQFATLLGMKPSVNVRDLLDGHVTLQLESLDRLYLKG